MYNATTMPTDWIYFTAGGVIGLIGLALTSWALFADRSRGRKRCPKCFYDMTGIVGEPPYRCPECGREIKRARKLHKTRRRWRWAMFALIPVIASPGLFLTPKIQRDGWPSVMPNTVLILLFNHGELGPVAEELMGRLETDLLDPEAAVELFEKSLPNQLAKWRKYQRSGWRVSYAAIARFKQESLHDWQWRLFEAQCVCAIEVYHNLNEDESRAQFAFMCLESMDIWGEASIDLLIEMLDDQDWPGNSANWVIAELAFQDRLSERQKTRCFEVLCTKLPDHRSDRNTLALIARLKMAYDIVRPILLESLISEDASVRASACEALAILSPDDDEQVTLLICALTDSDASVRSNSAEALGAIGSEPDIVVPALISALSDNEPIVREFACGGLGMFEERAADAVPNLLTALGDDSRSVGSAAVWALTEIGPRALPVLELALEEETDDSVRRHMQSAIDAISRQTD